MQSITHTCGHTVTFRLSACGAIFQFLGKKSEPKAKCCASPNIARYSHQSCGPCERERALQETGAELAAVQAKFPGSGWNVSEEFETAQAEADGKLWARLAGLPDSKFKFKKLPKPGRQRAAMARPGGSLLRMEVKPEDVVGWGGIGWGGELSLAEEIARVEAQRAADGIPPLAPTISVFADDDWSDVTELGASEDIDDDDGWREVIELETSEDTTCVERVSIAGPEATMCQDTSKKSTPRSTLLRHKDPNDTRPIRRCVAALS